MIRCRPLRALVLLVLGTVIAQRCRADDLTDESVRQAIRRGIAYLKLQQDKNTGGWSEHPMQPAGLAALCTLAMLNCGEDPKSPEIQSALNYLRRVDPPQMTYATSLRIMVYCAADPEKDRLLIRQSVKYLEAIQIKRGNRAGSWGYSDRQGAGDNSNTQFALLALHEAERVGVQVDNSTWRLALAYWLNSQNDDGSWGYYRGQPPTGSMTCAGISSVVIAAGRLSDGAAQVRGGSVLCCGQQQNTDAVERALQWLGSRFSVHVNPGQRQGWLLYYLYGVERVGRMTGRRFIGQHDWYREGAEMLVGAQDQFDGHWKGLGHGENNPLVGTSLSLLFLSKGRRPVVIGKYKFSGDDWDTHPIGVPQLTRQIEMKWRRDLTWQTIDSRVATVEDLLEAPVLFLSGRESLDLTAEQKRALREYVNQGGFIFAEACNGQGCDGAAFDVTFRALMKELFPESRLRVLPSNHAVWYAEEKVLPSAKRPLLGIDACCRTSVVYCPANLSCLWELGQGPRRGKHPANVQQEIDECTKIGMNVVAYATNRNLKEKLDSPTIASADGATSSALRGVLTIPKIAHAGGSDDAPNALANLLSFMHQKLEMRVSFDRKLLLPEDDSLYQYPILFAHGRRDFQFTPDQRKALAGYVRHGGFVLADAICASPQFASAFRREVEAMFPDATFVRVTLEHPLFTPEFGGFDIRTVTLNDPLARGDDDRLEARQARITPLIEGLEVDGRLAILFSPYDLSCALESQASMECKGYIKADAAKIGTNILLYALQQ